jgi:hypothetical protein
MYYVYNLLNISTIIFYSVKMSSSEVSTNKRVTFSDEGAPSKPQPKFVSRKKQSASSRATDDIKKIQNEKAYGKQQQKSSSSSSSTSSKSTARKSLVRDVSLGRPTKDFKITRATSEKQSFENQPPNLMGYDISEMLNDMRSIPLSIPSMQSNIDTARKIQALSELDLDTARLQNKAFEIDQDRLSQKVC